MSAYYVGHDHINAMLTVLQHTGFNEGRRGYWIDKPTHAQLTDLGKILIAENLRSLKARYPGDTEHDNGGEVTSFVCEPDLTFYCAANPRSMGDLFACYEYQSCEHTGWEASYAKRICDGAYKCILRKVPTQEHMRVWPYESDRKAPKVISLSSLVKA